MGGSDAMGDYSWSTSEPTILSDPQVVSAEAYGYTPLQEPNTMPQMQVLEDVSGEQMSDAGPGLDGKLRCTWRGCGKTFPRGTEFK